MSFTLGGKTAKELGIRLLEQSQVPILPETRDRTLSIPGRHGRYDFGADIGPRFFELECGFIYASDEKELQETVRNLASHLMDNKGNPKDLELIFDREPDKKYTVRYAGNLPIERIAYHSVGLFTLPLVAYDSFAYSDTRLKEVIAKTSPEQFTVENNGEVFTRPVITLTNEGDNTLTGVKIRREKIIE